mmetsp:Transcript_27328/g.59677  ORF Transcript_27328/g.59677 Transcript_27328/m.59677 type:complete len:206 (+) Transcript_27328:94-711(+)
MGSFGRHCSFCLRPFCGRLQEAQLWGCPGRARSFCSLRLRRSRGRLQQRVQFGRLGGSRPGWHSCRQSCISSLRKEGNRLRLCSRRLGRRQASLAKPWRSERHRWGLSFMGLCRCCCCALCSEELSRGLRWSSNGRGIIFAPLCSGCWGCRRWRQWCSSCRQQPRCSQRSLDVTRSWTRGSLQRAVLASCSRGHGLARLHGLLSR